MTGSSRHSPNIGALGGNDFEVGHGGIATSQRTAALTTAVCIDQETYRHVEYLQCWSGQGGGRLQHSGAIR